MLQIKWKTKWFLSKILSILSSKNILFFIQKKITKRSQINIKEILVYWKFHLKNINTFNLNNILEVGAGKSLEQNIYLNLATDIQIRQTVIDVSNMLDFELFNSASNQISKILNIEKISLVQSIEEVKKNYDIEYIAPYNVEQLKIKNFIFDACISSNTFEHLPLEELRKTLTILKSIVKKNGIISAVIDYSDHYCHTDNTIGPLNFLKYSNKDWEKYNTKYLFQNRLRHQDYRKLFKETGYKILEEKKSTLGKASGIISKDFEIDNEETYILWGMFTLEA